MKILILRHGNAHPAKVNESDFDRELSDLGRLEIKKNFFNALQKLPSLDLVWVSPLKRAQQTAEEFCRLFKTHSNIELTCEMQHLLQPDDDPREVLAALQKLKNENILLVTHQPLASSILDILCGVPSGYYSMATASMACVECEYPAQGLANMLWISHPN